MAEIIYCTRKRFNDLIVKVADPVVVRQKQPENTCVCDSVYVNLSHMIFAPEKSSQRPPPSTRGRQKAFTIATEPQNGVYKNDYVQLHYGDTLNCYESWPSPTVIVSDGGYGVLGFEGDTTDHLSLPEWS